MLLWPLNIQGPKLLKFWCAQNLQKANWSQNDTYQLYTLLWYYFIVFQYFLDLSVLYFVQYLIENCMIPNFVSSCIINVHTFNIVIVNLWFVGEVILWVPASYIADIFQSINKLLIVEFRFIGLILYFSSITIYQVFA